MLVLFSCNENIAQAKNELERYKNECLPINKDDFYSGKPCIKEKEFLTCTKFINEIKNKGLANFFWGKRWENSYEYLIDNQGVIKIKYIGPDGRVKIFKKTGKISKLENRYFFSSPSDPDLNRPEISFPIRRIDCELDNSNFDRHGTFVMFTLSDGEEYQYGISPKGDPLIGYRNSENLFKPEVLPNPEVWHKISLILSE